MACASSPAGANASAGAAPVVAPRILGGRPAPLAEATVALRDDAGRLVCSGVLVAPRAVLTAAHCLPLPGDGSPAPRDVCFGPRVDACTSAIRVSGYALHPAWDPLFFRGDLAVVALAGDAPVAPVALADHAIAPGADVEIVGYGRREADASTSSGEKRVGLARIDAVEDGRVVHGEASCNGDSGGPVFATSDPSRVAAITSSGPPGCRARGKATLVAPSHAWITGRIDAIEGENDAPGACAASPVAHGRGSEGGAGALLAVACAIGARLTSRRAAQPRARRPSPSEG
jgi:hypothetical protein